MPAKQYTEKDSAEAVRIASKAQEISESIGNDVMKNTVRSGIDYHEAKGEHGASVDNTRTARDREKYANQRSGKANRKGASITRKTINSTDRIEKLADDGSPASLRKIKTEARNVRHNTNDAVYDFKEISADEAEEAAGFHAVSQLDTKDAAIAVAMRRRAMDNSVEQHEFVKAQGEKVEREAQDVQVRAAKGDHEGAVVSARRAVQNLGHQVAGSPDGQGTDIPRMNMRDKQTADLNKRLNNLGYRPGKGMAKAGTKAKADDGMMGGGNGRSRSARTGKKMGAKKPTRVNIVAE